MDNTSIENEARLNRKRKSLFIQLRHFRKEYQKISKIYEVAKRQFFLAVLDYTSKNDININHDSTHDRTHLGPKDNKSFQKKSAPIVESEDVKKIFRKIAKQTHPDMLIDLGVDEKVEKIKLFQEARQAAIKKDWMTLFEIAQDLGVDMPQTTDDHNIFVKHKINEVRDKLTDIQRDPIWAWHHTNSEKIRLSIITRYIQTQHSR